MFIHFSTIYHTAVHQKDISIYWTHRSPRSSLLHVWNLFFHILFFSNIQRIWKCVWPCDLFRGLRGSLGCMHDMTLQATPGHIWTVEGSPALTPAHLELTHSETVRRCINNTHTYVQYVLHGKYTNVDRHALLHQRTNKRPHTCVVRIHVFEGTHLHKDKIYAKSCNHTHTQTRCSWSVLPSHELWAWVFILCMKGDLCFITLPQREIWAGAADVWGAF